MPRRSDPFPFALPPRPRGLTASRWLYDALRRAILDGRLALGARLPTTRELARHQGLARGTVVTAFENLKAEGYVEATVGSGTYVACELPESLLVAPRAAAGRPAAPPPSRLSAFARGLAGLEGYPDGPTRAFRVGLPALDLFPTALWAQVSARRLRAASSRLLLGCGPLGHRPLREAIAQYLVTSRGVRCTADQVAIVSGTIDALHATVRLLVEPGGRVAAEHPGYMGARRAIEAAGAVIAPVPVDDEGLRVEARRLAGARLVYTTPAHQHPLGMSMSASRRLALLEWARGAGATVFEDDYDSEFRFCGPPMPAMQGLDTHGVVVFSGSFSKSLFPSLRIGYVVLPADLIEPFERLQSVTQRHHTLPDQAVLADFIAGGHFGRHVRRMREAYAERRAALVSAADRELHGRLEVCTVEAGLQTVGWLRGGHDPADVARRLVARQVEVTPLQLPGENGDEPALHLGFAAVDARELRRGVRELAEVLRRPARRPG